MSLEEIYRKGVKIWVTHVNRIWEPALILENYVAGTNQIIVRTDFSKEIQNVVIRSNSTFPPLCYDEDFEFDDKKNLASLRYIHEACVLHVLRTRFERKLIYSFCGVATVILNPFINYAIRDIDRIENFQDKIIDDFEPHIFTTAEKAFYRLERECCDQSIIFTGITASGKTVNVNKTILYLTTMRVNEEQIKRKIIASSTILEAFGSAKTIRNESSSRFGKFIRLLYDREYYIVGAEVKTFLLEKSRVTYQAQCEQNFNIFYALRFVNDHFPNFHFYEQTFNYRNTTNDLETFPIDSLYFNDLIEAFNTLGFPIKQQKQILQILVAILHLGNVNFKKCENIEVEKESCFISGLDHLQLVVAFLSLNASEIRPLRKWLCHRKIEFRRDEILQPLSVAQATRVRDSMAKFLYTRLFNWIVAKINLLFRAPCSVQCFIGILDMCGFEKLEENSFEQFCVNYVNEKVQQYCVQMLFKCEQEDYLRENIGWKFIRYHDNRLCIDILESKVGVINVIDEESKSSSESTSWVDKLPTKIIHTDYFSKVNNCKDFIIQHFVDHVRYETSQFLEKNRDAGIIKEHIDVLMHTKNDILYKLIMDESYKQTLPMKRRRTKIKARLSLNTRQNKKTMISEYSDSWSKLKMLLQCSTPHYVRCIKSNDERKTHSFNAKCVVKQLRAYNVCGIVEISSKGFFNNPTYAEFFNRYYCLCQFEGIKRDDLQETCRMIVYTHIEDITNVKFGKTKVFVKEPAINHLEVLRRTKQNHASTVIQKSVRRYLQQLKYQRLRCAVLGLQQMSRKYLDRMRKETEAAIKIQAFIRGRQSRRRYQELKRFALALRNYTRLHLERRGIAEMEMDAVSSAAIDIQRHFRGFLARRIYERKLRNIVIIQACVRRFLSRIARDKSKTEKSRRIEMLSKGYKTKVDALQVQIDEYVANNLQADEEQRQIITVDDEQCIQAKSRILNNILIDKIQNLKVLCNSHNNHNIMELPAEDAEKDDENNLEIVPEVEQENVLAILPADEELEDANELEICIEDPIIVEDNVVVPPVAENAIVEPILPENGRGNANVFRIPAGNPGLAYESIRAVNKSSLSEIFKQLIEEEDNFKTLQPLFQALYNFDETIRVMKKLLKLRGLVKIKRKKRRNRGILIREVNEYNNYQGMFEFMVTNSNMIEIMSRLVIDLQLTDIPNSWLRLPSRILLMCIRYIDLLPNDYHLVHSSATNEPWITFSIAEKFEYFLEHYITAVQLVVKQRNNLDTIFFWLVNTHQLLNYLKQYARIYNNIRDQFHQANTYRQNQQCLKRLNVIQFWQHLHETCLWLVSQAEVIMKTAISDLVHLGILEYRPDFEFDSESSSTEKDEEEEDSREVQLPEYEEERTDEQAQPREEDQGLQPEPVQEPNYGYYQEQIEENDENSPKAKLAMLVQKLTEFLKTMRERDIKSKMILQIFKRLFDFISTILMCSIISRPELCNCYRGSVARLNLMAVEVWASNNQIGAVVVALGPIKQALRLLQMQPINEEHQVHWISKYFDKLNDSQIMTILRRYQPAYAAEGPIPGKILSALEFRLSMRGELSDNDDTILIESEDYLVGFPFTHCSVKLEEVEIPESFQLPMLTKI